MALYAMMTLKDEAKAARLRQVSDARPGITRAKHGEDFLYNPPDGTPITDEALRTAESGVRGQGYQRVCNII